MLTKKAHGKQLLAQEEAAPATQGDFCNPQPYAVQRAEGFDVPAVLVVAEDLGVPG